MNAPNRVFRDHLDTPIGRFVLLADSDGRLCAAGFIDGHARMERQLALCTVAVEDAKNPSGLTTAMRRYFDGDLAAIDRLPVNTGGTDFQRRVWQALREIPCGETWTYARLARRIGRPTAVRAVGLANGANPVAIVAPCHRVLGANGALTGYGGGLERKRWLLAHERARGSGQLGLPLAGRESTKARPNPL
jgi:methylated-DNA-[protein]-cysteine S-methyltransferase